MQRIDDLSEAEFMKFQAEYGEGGEPVCSPYNIVNEHGRLLSVGTSSPKTYAITAGVPASHSPDQRQLVM